MRGTLRADDHGQRILGIIPAYAGNTLRWRHGSCRCRDHPRVCGEHLTSCVMVVSSMGSSPRMRGTLVVAELLGHESGIIPAYAGNTWNRQRQASPCWDHPRVCGEHAVLNSDALPFTGSSPRMRGTPVAKGPAMVMPRDHPRVCGEHILSFVKSFSWLGSSPRMRGTLGRGGARRVFRGIIPAYAGNTLDALSVASMVAGSSPRMRGTQVE